MTATDAQLEEIAREIDRYDPDLADALFAASLARFPRGSAEIAAEVAVVRANYQTPPR